MPPFVGPLKRRLSSPIEIVTKLRAVAENGSVPAWLEEALWFLQFESTLPGGLARVAKEIVQAYPERVGPAVLHSAWKRKNLTAAEAVTFWSEVPERCKRMFATAIPDAWLLEVQDESDELFGDDPARRQFVDYPEKIRAIEEFRREKAQREKRKKERANGMPEIHTAALASILIPIAETELARSLDALCRIPNSELSPACWAFPTAGDTLRLWMGRRAEVSRAQLAPTAVVAKVFDALDFAWESNVMVQIEGDPRHGKTEAISTYCAMHSGRTRLVTVPCENSDSDFFIAIAEGLGITVDNPGNVAGVRRDIDWILKHSRLMIIWDEAHWLVPQRYSENTPPSRMNWLRTRVADRGLPTALIITPQSFNRAFDNYIQKTKYRFEQFFGRTARFELPATLTREDVIAVAHIHFPAIPLPYLKLIAGQAMKCAGYLQAVEFTARWALHLAKKAGREGQVTEEDVEQAIAQMMPAKPVADREKRSCTPSAKTLQDAPARDGRRGAPEPISGEDHSDPASRVEASLLVA